MRVSPKMTCGGQLMDGSVIVPGFLFGWSPRVAMKVPPP